MPDADHETEYTSVLLNFKFGYDPIIPVTGHHNIPTSFIHSTFLKKRLDSTIGSIIDSYDGPGTLLQHSNQQCPICGKPSAYTSISKYPHHRDPSQPRIDFGIIGFWNAECMVDIKEMAYNIEWEIGHSEEREEEVAKKCEVCGKFEGTKSCNKCKVTAYCGKEHQKDCAKLAQEEAMAE